MNLSGNPHLAVHYAKDLLIRQLVVLTGCAPQTVKELPLAELARLRDEAFDNMDKIYERVPE